MQDKTPKNKQNQYHGWWEKYYENGQLYWKGLYQNDNEFGRFESYNVNGSLEYIEHYINGAFCGYVENRHTFETKIIYEYYAR